MKDDWKTVFPSEITAIDILLKPDATMLKHAAANNAGLLKVYPKGFALDAAHTPHITMLQCFVRTADLEKLYAAEEKVLAAGNVNAMKLEGRDSASMCGLSSSTLHARRSLTSNAVMR